MLPYLSGSDLKSIDERAGSEYGVSLTQLMEVAGTRMAEFLRSEYSELLQDEVLVITGKGNNGGDGLVTARVLNNWGVKVKIFTAFPPAEFSGVPRQQLESCLRSSIPLLKNLKGQKPNLIVDSLFGFGFQGELRDEHRKVINWINKSKAKVFSCDLPSGMNSATYSGELTVKANCTLTFTVPKLVFQVKEAKSRAGDLYLLDIGIPRPLYEELGVNEALFRHQSWILLGDEV